MGTFGRSLSGIVNLKDYLRMDVCEIASGVPHKWNYVWK